MESNEQPVLIYDGECRFCTGAVKFLKAENSAEGLRFIPSSDSSVKKILEDHHIDKSTTGKTVVLVDRDRIYTKSSAIIRSLQRKGSLWRMVGMLLIIPGFLRDMIYDWVAAMRR